MKKAIFSTLLLVRVLTQATAASEAYEINPESSTVLFKVRLLWTTNIEGCFCGGVSGRGKVSAYLFQEHVGRKNQRPAV
jgi:polyisoprenoid-binding protein YceI